LALHRQRGMTGRHEPDAVMRETNHVTGVLGVESLLLGQLRSRDTHLSAIAHEPLFLCDQVAEERLADSLRQEHRAGMTQRVTESMRLADERGRWNVERQEDRGIPLLREPSELAQRVDDEVEVTGARAHAFRLRAVNHRLEVVQA